MNTFAWFGQFARDLRFGARNLSKTRAFTAIAIGSLALGIGGSTAMYSVIHAVILDPFPYQDPDHLMSVNVQGQRGGNYSSYSIDQFLLRRAAGLLAPEGRAIVSVPNVQNIDVIWRLLRGRSD